MKLKIDYHSGRRSCKFKDTNLYLNYLKEYDNYKIHVNWLNEITIFVR